MAEKVTPPLLKLPEEMKKRLTTMQDDIDKARHAVSVLKKLGMDTAALEEKLVWSEEVRKTLLTEFG